METVNSLFLALFVVVFFMVTIFVIIGVLIIMLMGMIKFIHEKNYSYALACLFMYLFLGGGVSIARNEIGVSDVHSEERYEEQEFFIQEFLFEEDDILIERYSRKESFTRYHVMEENEVNVFVVDIYDEEAFGLPRYHIEEWNRDGREDNNP